MIQIQGDMDFQQPSSAFANAKNRLDSKNSTSTSRNPDISRDNSIDVIIMAEDTSSAESSTIPFPTLTIIYLISKAESVIEEISQKYNNITVEECYGFFSGGVKQDYKKITIWSQGIDSLWFNALIARVKEVTGVETVPVVSGGIMYSV